MVNTKELSDKKVTIWFSPGGEVVNQFNWDEYYQEFIDKYNAIKDSDEKIVFSYCTDLGIMISRIAIIRGIVDFKDVDYKFKDYILSPDENARLSNWPKGFCDIRDDIYEELLSVRYKRNIKEN